MYAAQQDPVAIIGSACRFPGGANNPSKLWQLLKEPRDVLRPIPGERFNAKAFHHPDPSHHGTGNVLESYVLEEDVRLFDAGFFGVKGSEVHAIDPQQRLLLETVYESLESAGQRMEDLSGSDTAVYVGQMWNDYNDHLMHDIDALPTYTGTGTARSIMSNRVSHFFNWHGPSVTIDTACSSSLVAVYDAVSSLRQGVSRVAVAAGANLILTAEPFIGESKLRMLSYDSRSRMWDSDAKGYARGEGVAALVLKKLSDALADGDVVECVIREVGVNQDGRTPEGITVPSQYAQRDLIQKTYARAGLEATRRDQRCQYFEAHGTGTQAGDPKEAEAIASAFFGDSHRSPDDKDKLYVGSIKTVMGHSEGTAGIAGIMKASLALQNGVIPPNMLFNNLSPRVAPFYNNLQICTQPTPWPALEDGAPRRASVNSFGFGGTNSHAILEYYPTADGSGKSLTDGTQALEDTGLLTPIVFSAASGQALRTQIRAYHDYLKEQSPPAVSLRDLAYTLQARRSVHPVRAAFAVSSLDGLVARLAEWLSAADSKPSGTQIGVRASGRSGNGAAIMGVFTGQGAQWVGMGRELFKFPHVGRLLNQLDEALQTLPPSDRPAWSLTDELLADGPASRVGEAAFSQPLCTAVQIILVDLLTTAGVHFDAVVGHSSGEIGAAYAAGLLSARDAIRVAYYRGRVAQLVKSSGAMPGEGGMLAAGTTQEDAAELCGLKKLRGRLCVAAINSPSSVTLSGDLEAVKTAKGLLDDEGKFARLLKVDMAYHSHHMLPCTEPYLRAMEACNVQAQTHADTNTTKRPRWHSSVLEKTIMTDDSRATSAVSGQYWVDNMCKPVLFSQAVASAWASQGPFDTVIEVGPHPALKGPAMQTIQELLGGASPPVYNGVLSRGQDAVHAFSTALCSTWEAVRPEASHRLRLHELERQVSGVQGRLVKGLPTYCWDHDRIYWHDSRRTRAWRTRKEPYHPLLGRLSVDGLDQRQVAWHNMIKLSEAPWIRGHEIQGQVVFPAAGYAVTVIEAALRLAAGGGREPKLLQLRDLVIHKAMVLDDNFDIETNTSLKIQHRDETTIEATFEYSAHVERDADEMALLASGGLTLRFADIEGTHHQSDAANAGSVAGLSLELPRRRDETPSNLLAVDTDEFYSALEELGYNYTGPFRALNSIQRKLDYSMGLVDMPGPEDWEGSAVMLHPALLDASFQCIFAAMSWPRDGALLEVHVPTKIQNITLDVEQWKKSLMATPEAKPGALSFESRLFMSPGLITGDIDLFVSKGNIPVVQIQSITVVPLSNQNGSTLTRPIYLTTDYVPVALDEVELSKDATPLPQEVEMAEDLERTALFHMRQIDKQIPRSERAGLEPHVQYFFEFVDDILGRLANGTLRFGKQEWLKDSWDDFERLTAKWPESIDLQLQRRVGENFADAARGKLSMVETLFSDDLMEHFYSEALGLPQAMDWTGRIAGQLAQLYPHMNILELGAGTGACTKAVFSSIGDLFASYTFTDISSGFFDKAAQVFTSPRVSFKTLNIEEDIEPQGIPKAKYDLVIASNVLHATADLNRCLRNARSLLRPGGFLLIAEVTCIDVVRVRFPFSALPGWWLGRGDGRMLSATIDSTEWHERLIEAGFSGIDSVAEGANPLVAASSAILSQAVNPTVNFLRGPLSCSAPWEQDGVPAQRDADDRQQKLLILGGATKASSTLCGRIVRLLGPHWSPVRSRIITVPTLEDLAGVTLPPDCAVISLADLDRPVLAAPISEPAFAGLKNLFEFPRTILWVTCGAKTEAPQQNMSVGLGRVLMSEMPDLRLQFLDVEPDVMQRMSSATRLVTEAFLRWKALGDDAGEDILWSRDRELVLRGASLHAPRLHLAQDMNLRYAASRALVSEPTSVADPARAVTLRRLAGRLTFAQSSVAVTAPGEKSKLRFRTLVSSVAPCIHGLYAAIVTDLEGPTKTIHAVLTRSNASLLGLGEDGIQAMVGLGDLPLDNNSAVEQVTPQLLALLAMHLLASAIMAPVRDGSHVVVWVGFVPTPPGSPSGLPPWPLLLAEASRQSLSATGKAKVDLRFVASLSPSSWPPTASPDSDGWTFLPANSPLRLSRAAIPRDTDIFVDLSGTARLEDLVPQSCWCLAVQDIVSRRSPAVNHSLSHVLEQSVSLIHSQIKAPSDLLSRIQPHVLATPPEGLDLAQLDKSSPAFPLSSQTVIDWSRSVSPVSATVLPVDEALFFRPDRTYLFVGLTSDLGLSLCDWMIQRGARNFVLTSRRPQISDQWLKAKTEAGVTVRVFANDATDGQALRGIVDEVRASMPPIAGVANGAMVLNDKPFAGMPLESMTRVLDTKVVSTTTLDSIFDGTREELDFFILFSSIASIVGNRAQSNYSAGNSFMPPVVAQRRQRGLPASVMHVGAILGVGYMTRNLSKAVLDNLWNAGSTWISERDLHNVFAEAIFAGHPESGRNPELIIGLRQLKAGKDNLPIMKNPRYWQMVVQDDEALTPAQETTNAATSAKARLQDARTVEEVKSIISEAVVAKLLAALQLDDSRPADEVLSSSVISLGVDSLVAVNIRAWFASQLQVDMPVLKLLSGASVSELVDFSAGLMPADLTPKLGQAPAPDEVRPAAKAVELHAPASSRTPGPAVATAASRSTRMTDEARPETREPVISNTMEALHQTIRDGVQYTPSSSPASSSSGHRAGDGIDGGWVALPRDSSTSRSTSPSLAETLDLSSSIQAKDIGKDSQFELVLPKPDCPGASADIIKEVPMSPGQSRFWFLSQYVADHSAFNIAFKARLNGNLDVDRLSDALNAVTQAHESLRTSFASVRGSPVQRVHARSSIKLEHHLSHRFEYDAEAAYESLKHLEYNLEDPRLMRCVVITSTAPGPQSHHLIIGYHHINMDGISLEVFLADLQTAYRGGRITGRPQYPDFTIKQLQELEQGKLVNETRFWVQELSSLPPPLPLLPFSNTKSRQPLAAYDHNHAHAKLSQGVSDAVQSSARKASVVPFVFFLASYAVLLHRHLGVEDMCIGMADAGRNQGQYDQGIGMYLNILPLRLELRPSDSFADVLRRTRTKVQMAMSNGRLPFDEIVKAAQAPRAQDHNPIFQAFINYRPGVAENRQLFGCQGRVQDFSVGKTSYDICLDVIENPGAQTALIFSVQSSLYSPSDAKILSDSYTRLLAEFAASPRLEVGQTQLFADADVKRGIVAGRGPETEPTWAGTLVDRIDKIVAQQPGSVALVDGAGCSATYRGMQRQVDQIARAIKQALGRENVHGTRIAILCEPSGDFICCLLAVLRLGCTSVPLDARLPLERLVSMVSSSEAALILTHDNIARQADSVRAADNIPAVNVSDLYSITTAGSAAGQESQAPVQNVARLEDDMVIDFTSGTTGTPKGIVLTHQNIANFIGEFCKKCGTASSSVLQQSAMSFDMALWQVFVPLCSGGKLVIAPQSTRVDPSAVARLIASEQVTLTVGTPSEYASWLTYGAEDLRRNTAWQIAVIAGERYSFQVDASLRRLGHARLRLMNYYGPTEVGISCSGLELFPGDVDRYPDQLAPVGYTLPNYSVYVLDGERRQLPPGVPGEVYVAGAGICRSYLNNPSLTSSKFFPDPFASPTAKAKGWARMYATGDRGVLSNDGILTLLGRIDGDSQLKIRGIRTEPEEVEKVLIKEAQGFIEAVVVTPRGEGQHLYLVAHAALSSTGRALESTGIWPAFQQKLLQKLPLPPSMRPAVIVPIDKVPTTPHGKVDRKAASQLPATLPESQTADASADSDGAAISGAQKEMLQIWQRVLGIQNTPPATPDTDFFSLGGTSLQLVAVKSAIEDRFQISVPVIDLFKNHTLASMAALVANDTNTHGSDPAHGKRIEWQRETEPSLAQELVVPSGGVSRPVNKPPRVIILTGATGFVGRHLLRRLASLSHVEQVHCLAVRNPARLYEMEPQHKIVVHSGDLRHPTLSLDAATASKLAAEADLIIHNGADVSFLKSYDSLRAPNVQSTRFLTQLAAQRRVPLHYISSANVGRIVPNADVFSEVSVARHEPPAGYEALDAYGASKWASEVLLERASAAFSLPVVIHRLSNVTGEDVPESDIMGNIIRYSAEMRAVPIVTPAWRGVLDFISVGAVAEGVVRAATAGDNSSRLVRFLHQSSEEVVPIDETDAYVSRRMCGGEHVARLPLREWVARARGLGMSELVATFLEQSRDAVVVFQSLRKGQW